MTWLRIDDAFPEHEKVLALPSPGAKWLHVVALCQCAANLTDGHIDPKRLKVICAIADVRGTKTCIQQLVDVGLWIPLDDGCYQVKDYLDYNPDAATVKAQREARRAAGKAGADKRWHGNGYGNGDSKSYGTPGMHPDPGPGPSPAPIKPTEPVGDSDGEVHDFAQLQAAARLLDAIPLDGRDEGTERVVLGYARELPVEAFDEIRASLTAKLEKDGLFKSAGAYVNGALQKAARKAAA